jgi:hypothetical protein
MIFTKASAAQARHRLINIKEHKLCTFEALPAPFASSIMNEWCRVAGLRVLGHLPAHATGCSKQGQRRKLCTVSGSCAAREQRTVKVTHPASPRLKVVHELDAAAAAAAGDPSTTSQHVGLLEENAMPRDKEGQHVRTTPEHGTTQQRKTAQNSAGYRITAQHSMRQAWQKFSRRSRLESQGATCRHHQHAAASRQGCLLVLSPLWV